MWGVTCNQDKCPRMYVVPVQHFSASSLCSQALEAVFELTKRSRLGSADDLDSMRDFLDQLPRSLRLRLAEHWSEHWDDRWDSDRGVEIDKVSRQPGSYRVLSKYRLWRAICFLPDTEGARLVLPLVGNDRGEYGARAMRYVTDEYRGYAIKNTSLTLSVSRHYEEEPVICEDLFRPLLSRCVYLTEVHLGCGAGDLCLRAVGELCEKLKKLSVGDLSVTDAGFASFALNQRKNPCLRELHLKGSDVTLRGLSLVWRLPMAQLTTLSCTAQSFRLDDDDDADEEDSLLQCPNGAPTGLANLNVDWQGYESSASRKALLGRRRLFPALRRMQWESPQEDIVTDAAQTWDMVERLNQSFESEVDLRQVAKSFPNLVALRLRSVKVPSNPLRVGSFEFLRRFEFRYHQDGHDCLEFDTFRSIMAEAKNIQVVIVELKAQFISEYSDGPLCQMFRRFEHLRNLEWLELVVMPWYCGPPPARFPLTEATVSCVLQTCRDIRVLGDLGCWSVDSGFDLDIGSARRLGQLHEYKGDLWKDPFLIRELSD